MQTLNNLKSRKMAHKRIKYKEPPEGDDTAMKRWHLLSELGDGEYTACNIAVTEYEYISELKSSGGITCENCLDTIRYYKKIKL